LRRNQKKYPGDASSAGISINRRQRDAGFSPNNLSPAATVALIEGDRMYLQV